MFSDQQNQALTSIKQWFRTKPRKQIYRLFGYAGTGKTTLAKYIVKELGIVPVYCAFTGKAASVMRANGCENASTIHSLIYKPIDEDEDSGELLFALNRSTSPVLSADMIIIDECSMVDEVIAKDLMSFNRPILVLGDPAQLPPVGGEGYFINAKPDFMLTEIHRQAAENPIILMSDYVRNQNKLDIGEYGTSVVKKQEDLIIEDLVQADQIICGLNKTRQYINNLMRDYYGFSSKIPQKGEKLVCLRNDKKMGLYNGTIWYVEKNIPCKKKNSLGLQIIDDYDFKINVKVHNSYLTNENIYDQKQLIGTQHLTWGYALTTHKCQGSQWGNVVIFDESDVFKDNKYKWMYTALTRAQEKVIVYR